MDGFKQTLKELAEKLPDEMHAKYYEDDYWGPNLDFDCGGNILENQGDAENGKGIINLIQYIESEGCRIETEIEDGKAHISVYGPKDSGMFGEFRPLVHRGEWEDQLAEAVAKAALEVAKRGEK